jgi:hypothetical protein
VFALVLMVFTPSSQAITGEDGLLEHCYRAFLNRDPDQGGLDYWRGVLASGHGDAYAFMFSAEFNALATQIVTSQ